ncbi:transporter substrate-binding domain-containing protein [Pelomonas sp. APW6]|uniref:Transporter substrate-binding domain-containing protein n=1 Tax=Roseateles subflavus TaxID=3053353 RepID=A0ABT7LCF5_9BURK|nr:transporter substrate-binding domain-containing protein [Pelomonas sp. APW6]MDL5030547.1 transporter substrate-binding domain-containing protein [Pelomonas sp. APW6]
MCVHRPPTRPPTRRACLQTLLLAGAGNLPAWASPGPGLDPLLGYAHSLPPLSYEEGGRVQGLFVDLFREMAAQLGLPAVVEIQPFLRLQQSAMLGPSVVAFPLVRLPEREEMYQWIGPVLRRRVMLYRLAQRQDLEFKGWSRLGGAQVVVNKGTATHRKLLEEFRVPAAQLQVSANYATAVRMLVAGRADFMAMNELAAAWAARQQGLASDALRPVQELDGDGAYWFGVVPGAKPLAQALQEGLEQLRRQGRVEALRRQYGV